jgi:hypothetical protein
MICCGSGVTSHAAIATRYFPRRILALHIVTFSSQIAHSEHAHALTRRGE